MPDSPLSAHARVTAICVNLALDEIEAEIEAALEEASAEQVAVLERLRVQVKRKRVTGYDAPIAAASIVAS